MRRCRALITTLLIAVFIAGCGFAGGAAAPVAALPTVTESALPQPVSSSTPVPSEAGAFPSSSDVSERLFGPGLSHHLTVYISRNEWLGMSQDMLDYAEIDVWMRTGNCRHANLVYEDEDGIIEIDDIGLRTRGNTTRILPEDEDGYHRAHFTFEFNETFDFSEGSTEYQEHDQRALFGLTSLDLKWNLWTDRSHIRELYAYSLMASAGVTAPRAALATLDFVIDGEWVHYGVYTMVEPVDKAFLTRHYGTQADGGNLYKCLWENIPATLESGYPEGEIGVKNWESGYRPSYDLKTNKSKADTSDLQAFIDSLNTLDDDDFAEYIESSFEVDKFLCYLAADVLLGNADDYRTMGNNYYLYFNPAGKIELIPYDFDACLGGGWEGGPACSFEILATEDIYDVPNLNAAYMDRSVSHPLADRILAIPAYRQRYEQYLLDFINSGLFSYEGFRYTFETLEAIYGPYTGSDTEDRGETMTLTNEKWFFEAKTKSILSRLGDATW